MGLHSNTSYLDGHSATEPLLGGSDGAGEAAAAAAPSAPPPPASSYPSVAQPALGYFQAPSQHPYQTASRQSSPQQYAYSYSNSYQSYPEAAAPPGAPQAPQPCVHQPLCSECGYRGPTVSRREAGFFTWFTATILCMGGCFPFCFLPFCSDCLADTVFRCSNCGSVLGRLHA